MKNALKVLNKLEARGLVERYAIGGAVGTIYYLEPFFTKDLDIFVLVPQSSPKAVIDFSEIYDYCRGQGYTEFISNCLVIDNVPVDFIPASGDLEVEAVLKALEIDFEGVPTKVMTAEHLTAIMLQTGRDKDRVRIRMMLEQANLDMDNFFDILKRHHLYDKWLKFTGEGL